ncbi:SH3 domain-containing protein [Roseibium sp. RKSG952]|uniref:SH3 domain-containing protein n=1 Tax=Roseibium sp. RKSG952 TaxID=2529384 RepID=UPI001AD92103|nr:SH3 domain-containing protein [Roseibium sp. RKSG952]
MTRLILVTFAMLGWTFYVMSGGPDFEPRGMRSDQPQQIASAPKPKPKPLVAAPAEELVTRAALRPIKPAEPQAEPESPLNEADTDALLSQVASGLSTNLTLFDDDGATFTLASLEQGAAGLQQVAPAPLDETAETPVPAEPEKDIREVSGTRVNMRDGPGTIYPIIGKARIGQKVEVLSESGTGWLRLRVLPEQQVGWISASLIRKIPN